MYIQAGGRRRVWGARGAQVPPPQVLAEIEAKILPCHPIFLYFNPVRTKDSFLALEESLVRIIKTCIKGQ